MAAPPPQPPALPDELFQEILLRLPPDDPACLLRAFLVCKAWGCAVSLPSFRRRLQELHRAPPLLGFLPNWTTDRTPRFIATTASSFSLDAPDCLKWRALDCRHGRALFLSRWQDPEKFLVWEPMTGAQIRLSVPVAFDISYGELPSNRPTAAVLCAADGCDHRDCLGGPFCVVVVFEDDTEEDQFVTSACIYSSETGAWGELTSLLGESIEVTENSSVLVGNSFLYFGASESILEYDLVRHALTLLSPPENCDCDYLNLMLTEDGRLGVVEDSDPHLKLWTRQASDRADARWVLSRVIYLRNLFPASARLNEGFRVHVMGFTEGANAVFVNSIAGVFILDLQSEQVRKVCDDTGFSNLVPLVTFYTPAPRGNHQNLLMSKPSEQAGGKEGGQGEKTIDQAQQLFDKGSNAINKGDSVNTFECISHDHNTREVAPACATTLNKYGCAYKAQEVNDSLDDVPKSAPNEESVKGTANKDEVGDSKDLW